MTAVEAEDARALAEAQFNAVAAALMAHAGGTITVPVTVTP